MKHDYNLKSSDREALRSLVGKRLVSYRLNMTDGVSYEVFVFRLFWGLWKINSLIPSHDSA
jgi:hypothetical protein